MVDDGWLMVDDLGTVERGGGGGGGGYGGEGE